MAVLNSGSGIDGDAVASVNANLHTESLVGRAFPDMICYNVTFLASQSATLDAAPDGIAAGDKVLLINLQGAGTSQTDNVGNWEILDVAGVGANSISFVSAKSNVYGDNGTDNNIGTSTSNHRVVVQRIPQYNTLTVDSGVTLTCNDWNKVKYGVFCVMVKGVLTMNGTINADAKGYLGYSSPYDDRYGVGGSYGRPGYNGGGYSSSPNQGGGGSGAGQGRGGGGAYGTNGTGNGGTAYGSANLNKIFFGSAGGNTYASYTYHIGADGGGIVMLIAGEFNCNGVITTRSQYWETGPVDPDHSGGGAGGSILIRAGLVSMNSGSLIATGSFNGGVGRIAVYYNTLNDSLSNSSPAAYEDSSLQLPFKLSGTMTQPCEVRVYTEDWTFVDSQSLSSGNWEIGNLPSEGPFHIIAVPDSPNENLIGYKSVTAL